MAKDTEYMTPEKEADAKPPKTAPAPKWYHKLFNFIPANRRRIDEYNRSARSHAEWEREAEAPPGAEPADRRKSVPEQRGAARAADGKSAAADGETGEPGERAYWRKQADVLKEAVREAERGIEIMTNVYGSRPRLREDWVKKGPKGEGESGGLYTEKSFRMLTPAAIDPADVEIGGKALTEREFAAIAMFGAVDADIGVAAQKASVADPKGAIEFFKMVGYSEKQAKQIIADSVGVTYTQDVLRAEPRMYRYFGTAMNGGRARAAEALNAYRSGDKAKLAEIMGRAVKTAGSQAGVSDDRGVHPLGKAAGEMLSLMERDGELKAMAKASFEREEREFCEGTPFQPRSFEEMTDSIQKMQKFAEVREKGIKARADLAQARAEGRELTTGEKKGCVRDILTARLAEGMRQSQLRAIRKESRAEGTMNYEGLTSYCDRLGEQLESFNLAISTGGSLPSSAPLLLSTGMECRVVKKPPILSTVADEEKLAEITRTADKIIEMDQLGEKSVDYLAENVIGATKLHPYNISRVMEAAVKARGIDKKPAREKDKPSALTGPKAEAKRTVQGPQVTAPRP